MDRDHDPLCPQAPCCCETIARVRSEEKGIAQGIWRVNLPLIERRNYDGGYDDGYADACTGRPHR